MPISSDLYTVYQDGRPIFRGLYKTQAYAQAEILAHGYWKKRANEKRRIPHIEVKLDKELVKQEDQLYNWAKQGR